MKSLHLVEAPQRCGSSTPYRSLGALLGGLFLSSSSLAAEGEHIRLDWTGTDRIFLIVSAVLGLIGILVALYLRSKISRADTGTPQMLEVSQAIEAGALAYLKQQIRMMSPFVALLAVGLFFVYKSLGIAAALVSGAFILGVISSYSAGFVGMMMAVRGNVRVASAAITSNRKALEIAFHSGSVAGLITVGVGLLCSALILLVFPAHATTLLVGYGFGGSLAALFMRVGGGIFTKAADVGADLVGKVEANIPEDSPMNPATIADNVGDNVGDCAGMAADVFESYEVMLVASIVLGAATSAVLPSAVWPKLIVFALVVCGLGILASILGIFTVKGSDDLDSDPLRRILKGFRYTAIASFLGSLGASYLLLNDLQTVQFMSSESSAYFEANKIGERIKAVAQAKPRTKAGTLDWSAVQVGDVMDAEELRGNPLIKMAKESPEPEAKTLLFENIRDQFKERGPFAVKPLTGFRELTVQTLASADNPVADLCVSVQPMTSGGNEKVLTIKDWFGKGDEATGKFFQQTTQELTTTGPDGKPRRTVQTMWTGPATKAELRDQIKNMREQAAKTPGTKLILTVEETKPASLYYNPETGELACFAVGISEGTRLVPTVGVQVYNEKASVVEKYLRDRRTDPKLKGPRPKALVVASGVKLAKVPWFVFPCLVGVGIALSLLIEAITNYYVSTNKRPTREVAGVATAGPAPMIIQGFAYASESSVFMVLAIVGALIIPLLVLPAAAYGSLILAFYGIALIGIGLLTTTGYVLAMDTFGPISDNAQGVFEMGGQSSNEYGSTSLQRLDAAGNTTKALTKGFAIATAVVASIALFQSFVEASHLQLQGLRVDLPHVFFGVLIGAASAFLFSAFSINAVGRAAFELISEVRSQFRENPGILKGESKPDYARCVALVTAAAQRELIGPGVLAIMLPIAVGFGFSIGTAPTQIGQLSLNLTGAQALGGFLAGAIAAGQLMAVLLSNSGGMWDNAKKAIEDGLHGGKGTDEHRASVVCDTVGDPFKDTAGPALNPLIKVMNLVALLIVGLIVQPYSSGTAGIVITVIALGALIWAFLRSKKGSLAESMANLS